MKRHIALLPVLLCLCLYCGGFPAHAESLRSEGTPRVVDDAGLFLSAEARQMETRLSEIRQEIGKDIVIYTDVTTYGVSHAERAADFYDSNGYGVGADREGVCLFICMNPADRGWWACCTGPITMSLYTEAAANALDDALYEYMAAGEYAEGVADWIENFRTLYKKGVPFAPRWYPDLDSGFQRFHNGDAPRVVDDAGLLSATEISSLVSQAADISQSCGLDIAIHTTPFPVGLSRGEYSDLYYYYNGYGFGDGYDGILLTVYAEEGYNSDNRITASGTGADKLTEANEDRLYMDNEMILTFFFSQAQAESESLSKNVGWGHRRNFENGKVYYHYDSFLGYKKGADGQPEIDEEQAAIVRRIFARYLMGDSVRKICKDLEADGVKTVRGCEKWSDSTVQNMLQNEKYIGDALLQKTFIEDIFSRKSVKNVGQLAKFYTQSWIDASSAAIRFSKRTIYAD